jgi:hypothetical protein
MLADNYPSARILKFRRRGACVRHPSSFQCKSTGPAQKVNKAASGGREGGRERRQKRLEFPRDSQRQLLTAATTHDESSYGCVSGCWGVGVSGCRGQEGKGKGRGARGGGGGGKSRAQVRTDDDSFRLLSFLFYYSYARASYSSE